MPAKVRGLLNSAAAWARPLAPRLALVLIGLVAGVGATLAVLALHPAAKPARPQAAIINQRGAHRRTSPTPTPSPTPTETPSAAPAPATAGAGPLRLVIPSIGVNATVEDVGVTPQGAMDVPSNVQDVGWYARGPQPGEPGDAVIDGHLDWYTGPAVFWHLAQLQVGGTIEVEFARGQSESFRVTQTLQVPYNQPPPGLFVAEGSPQLTLITCAGQWNGTEYQNRLVVDAAPA